MRSSISIVHLNSAKCEYSLNRSLEWPAAKLSKHAMVWFVIFVFTTMLNCLCSCHAGVHLQSLYNNDGSFSSLEEIAFLNEWLAYDEFYLMQDIKRLELLWACMMLTSPSDQIL
jgi:hypothetical protein